MPPGSCVRLLLLLSPLAAAGCGFSLPSPPLTSSYVHTYLAGPSAAGSRVTRSGVMRTRVMRTRVMRTRVTRTRVAAPPISGRRAILRALSGSACPYPTSARVMRRIGNVVVAVPWCGEPDPRSVGAEDARERELEEQLRRHGQQSGEAEPLPVVSAPPPPELHREAIIYAPAATPGEESHADATTRELAGPRVYRVPTASDAR